MHRTLCLFAILTFSLILTGCETNDPNESTSASAIPWNKPASWEGAGALGAMGFQGSH